MKLELNENAFWAACWLIICPAVIGLAMILRGCHENHEQVRVNMMRLCIDKGGHYIEGNGGCILKGGVSE